VLHLLSNIHVTSSLAILIIGQLRAFYFVKFN
jgi:hypothetical protein